ncbi:TPA: NYN domain-containing protein [Photobacterium damselae]
MPTTELPTIALFVDADNTSSSNFAFAIEQLSKRGLIHYRYLKSCLSSWQEVGQLHAAQFIQVFDLCSHKNASDIAMVVDILEWNQSHPDHTIAIMSSDSDFTPLLNQLRRRQITTIGIGNAHCSKHLKKSFNTFIPFPIKDVISTPKPMAYPDSKSKILVETAKSLNANMGAVSIGMIGAQLKGRLTYPAGQLKKLLQEYPQFFSISGNYVRLKIE